MLRRLREQDADLLREACSWDDARPSWYREMDATFSLGTVEDFITQLSDWRNAFMGIFNPDLTAIILVVWCEPGRFTAHVMAKHGTDLQLVTTASKSILYDLLDFDLEEVSVWVAERNKSIRKLCASLGLLPDGVVMWKGSYRGRVIRWLRHSVRREQLLVSKAA